MQRPQMFRPRIRNTSRIGFTLIELLVVITIIVVLLALLSPALDQAVEHAARLQCAGNLHAIDTAIPVYALDYRRSIPPMRERGNLAQNENHWPRLFRLWDVDENRTDYWNLGILWKNGQLRDGRAYFCPSQKVPAVTYATYSSPSFPTDSDFGTPLLNGLAVRSSYFYNPTTISEQDRARRYRRLVDLSGSALLVFDLLAESVAYIAHGEDGFNRAFGDGSVRFSHEPEVAENLDNIDFKNGTYGLFDDVIEELARD